MTTRTWAIVGGLLTVVLGIVPFVALFGTGTALGPQPREGAEGCVEAGLRTVLVGESLRNDSDGPVTITRASAVPSQAFVVEGVWVLPLDDGEPAVDVWVEEDGGLDAFDAPGWDGRQPAVEVELAPGEEVTVVVGVRARERGASTQDLVLTYRNERGGLGDHSLRTQLRCADGTCP